MGTHKKKATTQRTNNKKTRKTYCVNSDYYSDQYVNALFNPRDWEKDCASSHVDYLYVDGKYYWDPSLFKKTTGVKNVVDEGKLSISSKNRLMTNLTTLQAARPFLMPQLAMDLQRVNQGQIRAFMKPGTVYIFKPVASYAGRGIRMVTNFNELRGHLKRGSKQHRHWVLQEYIVDPLLYKGHKFHIRHYFFYVPGGTSYYGRHGEIATAAKPYVAGDWGNTAIHDTHFGDRDGEIFPEALGLTAAQQRSVDKQLAAFYACLLKVIPAGCYPETERCYELFGVDLMLTSDLKLKVLEVNTKLGLPSAKSPIAKMVVEGSLHTIVKPLLGMQRMPTAKGAQDEFIAIRSS